MLPAMTFPSADCRTAGPATAAAHLPLRGAMVRTAPASRPPRRPRSSSALAALLLLGALPAQSGSADAPATDAAAQDLEQLVQQVEQAHRTADAPPVPGGFRATLQIQTHGSEQRVTVELKVLFREWETPAGRSWPLIRYEQIDAAKSAVHGRDTKGFWALLDGRVRDLQHRDLEADYESCRRNLKLARQMLRFLEPAQVLRRLQEPGPVREEVLRLSRGAAVPCRTVSGRLAGFPLRQQAGEDAPVQAKVFVGPEGHLLALEVTPLDENGAPEQGAGEFLYFRDYRELSGRWVPGEVLHFAVPAAGERRLQMEVGLITLALDGDIPPAAFDRPD